MNGLDITLLYLLAAVLGVVACRSLKLPPMLGYLFVGVVIGPNTLALAHDSAGVRYLAEFGVVLLMFVIGLEFSLPKLKVMRSLVFGLGLAQVGLTVVLTTLGSLGLAWLMPHWWHMEWQTALALGGVMSMSSTAIVIKLVAERLELDSDHGKRVVGILLFQDLAVVPLLVLIPALGSPPAELAWALGLAMVKASVLLGLLLTGGQKLLRWWLNQVARRKSEELFMLNLLLITLGLAWVTEHAGLSMALGSFVAGMLISETEYKHQVETDIRPFHDVLLGLFFITIGMMLDWRLVLERWPLVLLLITAPVLLKLGLIAGLSKLMGASLGTSLRTGLYLAQAGEFGFVLLTLAGQNSLVPPELFNPILAAMVLSMLATPFIIMVSNPLVMKLVGSDWLMQSVQMTTIAKKSMGAQGHVIICGYGRCGQNLARLLEKANIPYMALDLDPDRVHKAAGAGDSVVYGDATRSQALTAAGLARASAVAITYINNASAMKVLSHLQHMAPHVPVVVRTLDDANLDMLQAAGATEVVPEAIEASLMLASHALALVGVPMRKVLRMVQEQREERYSLLRGYFHGDDDDTADDLDNEHLSTFIVAHNHPCVGQTLGTLALSEVGVRVVNLRSHGKPSPFTENTVLHVNDTLVLSGKSTALALAEEKLTAH
jgi:CPA2 family monovalent cation:H+ antiporter-2